MLIIYLVFMRRQGAHCIFYRMENNTLDLKKYIVVGGAPESSSTLR